jgi:hypothetical protein
MTLRRYDRRKEDHSRTDWLITAVLVLVILILFVMADMQRKAQVDPGAIPMSATP